MLKSGARSCVVSTDSTACLAFPTGMTEMATRPRACFVSRFRVVALTTFVAVYPRRFLSRLRFPRAVPLSSLDSPRASNADPFSCLLAPNASRLFSFTAAHNRLIGGIEQGLGANRQSATVLHACNVGPSSCPHALQGRSIPMTDEGVGIFFARTPTSRHRAA